jgi:membrane-bound lytic murein transglycosylase B
MVRIFLLLGIALAMTTQALSATAYFNGLQAQLIQDGFNPDYVKKLYVSPQVVFDVDTVAYYFVQRESKMNYGRFLEDAPIKQAAHYLEKFNGIFTEVEKKYTVPKEIIAAILLVETRFGRITGNRSIFNTLSTLAALDHPRNKKHLSSTFTKKQMKVSEKQISKWASRKSEWAYGELKAYLTYIIHNKIDPFGLHGSYAGAFGFAQFLPSNVLQYGRDGDGDGKVDLFHHPDAIESIAYFLKAHGWTQNMSRQDAQKVLFAYNRSIYYVNTILSVADKLKGKRILYVSE